MATWIEQAGFERDPYEKLDPFKIDDKYFRWNRPDLKQARASLDTFIDDVSQQKRVGLKVFGPIGSGKTWICKILELELRRKDENLLFLYTKVPKVEPTFQVVYRIAMECLLQNYMGFLAKRVQELGGGTDRKAWERTIGENDLARMLAYYQSDTNRQLANKWLIGDKLTATELRDLKVVSAADSDFDRQELLKAVVKNVGKVFSTVVLAIDELENAIDIASALSDTLREMLDSFSERFALITSFTAQKDEEWYDFGYSEALNRRLDYSISLEALERDRVATFLRSHHQLYRRSDFKVKDQLEPFTEEGAMATLDATSEGNRYPGFYLANCREMVKLAIDKKVDLDGEFVAKYKDKMRFTGPYTE